MGDALAVVATAAGAFAGTNVDDLVLLAVLFTASRTAGRPTRAAICGGQGLGIGVLVAVAGVAALGLTIVPDRWIGLLGLVPLGLGLRGLLQTARARGADGPPEPPVVAASLPAIAAVTVANGADNLAVYTPLFRSMGAGDVVVTVLVFLAMTGVWLLAAALLGAHRRVTALIERSGRWLVPAVFVAIGCLVLADLA